ncbi:MAG: Asp-tRNA(Asn)/Glu-tRNA(Gln) amidotransferase subunit GatC [Ruminococcaceae bacterium]|nr:Asp-tRNA(Asn)/Glu-tRNA(Gln) amidotransferase subunit GatC [Oscillospiraceae bacterium]
MKIDIEKIANLSMLNLSEDEKNEFNIDLEEIISFAEEITKAESHNDTENINLNELKNIFREDIITNGSNREDLLKNAETNDGIYISVPKILGGN